MTKEELWKEWGYKFKGWMDRLLSAPVELVVSKDHSESYQMDSRHIFKLESGGYAFVVESGCSCYDSSVDAEIEVVSNLKGAKQLWNKKIETEGWRTQWAGERLS